MSTNKSVLNQHGLTRVERKAVLEALPVRFSFFALGRMYFQGDQTTLNRSHMRVNDKPARNHLRSLVITYLY